MNASPGRGRVENELGLPAFLLYRVIVIHGHNSVRIPVRGHAQVKDCIVQPKR
jgi:hypothetical protein